MPTLLEDNPSLKNTADVADTVVKIARQLAEESRSQRGVLSDINIDSDITKDLGFPKERLWVSVFPQAWCFRAF